MVLFDWTRLCKYLEEEEGQEEGEPKKKYVPYRTYLRLVFWTLGTKLDAPPSTGVFGSAADLVLGSSNDYYPRLDVLSNQMKRRK